MDQQSNNTVTVRGLNRALRIVRALGTESAWLEFTPLPNDEYEVKVRDDRASTLMKLAESADQDYLAETYGITLPDENGEWNTEDLDSGYPEIYGGGEHCNKHIASVYSSKADAIVAAKSPRMLMVIERLLTCPDLNLDSLEDETLEARDEAQALLDSLKVTKQ